MLKIRKLMAWKGNDIANKPHPLPLSLKGEGQGRGYSMYVGSNFQKHLLQFFLDFRIRKPNHPISPFLQKCGSLLVVFFNVGQKMNPAVHFHHQFQSMAIEISNVFIA